MTAPADTGDENDGPKLIPLTPAQEAEIDAVRARLGLLPDGVEPTPEQHATNQADARTETVARHFQGLYDVFCCYRAAGFRRSEALYLIAAAVTAGCRG